jgi:hypothetical protein
MPYMVDRDGVALGPYSLEDLQQKLVDNELTLSDRACDHAGGAWVPLSKLFAERAIAIPGVTTEKSDGPKILSFIKPSSGWAAAVVGIAFGLGLVIWGLMTLMRHH